MIRELKPLLSSRVLTFAVANVGDDRIRVNVFPTRLANDENRALSEPLSVEGTAEELDTELPAALIEYVATHMTIRQSLDRTKAEMEAAEKAAKDEANAKKAKLTAKKPGATTAKEPEKPKEAPEPEPPKPPSLFDAPPAEEPEEAKPESGVEISLSEFEDEILAEIREESQNHNAQAAA
jgi:PRTRC genetic system protein E